MGVGGAIVGIGAAAKEIYQDFSKTFIPGACQTQLEIENYGHVFAPASGGPCLAAWSVVLGNGGQVR